MPSHIIDWGQICHQCDVARLAQADLGCLSKIVIHQACLLLYASLLLGYPRRHRIVPEVSHLRSDLTLLCGTCGRTHAWEVLYEDALDVVLERRVG